MLGRLAQLREVVGPEGQRWPEATIPVCVLAEGIVCVDLDDAPLGLHLLRAGEEPRWGVDFDGADELALASVAPTLHGWLETWLRAPGQAPAE